MGQFVIVISGTGNHGCERAVGDGDHVLGCQRPDCVDCISREVVRRLKRNGVASLDAKLVHWPERAAEAQVPASHGVVEVTPYALVRRGQVVDDLVNGVRSGSF
jgi:hypothetical protein